MSRPPAPWWMYALAACFLGYVALFDYASFWGPGPVGVSLAYEPSGALVQSVTAGSAGERAGLQAGDRILAIDGMVARHAFEWNVIGANFEIGRVHRVEIERGGERRVLELKLGRQAGPRSLQDKILSWWLVVVQTALLGLAFLIAFRRPQELVARVGALLLVTLPVGIGYFQPPYGFAVVWRELPAPLEWPLWIPQAVGIASGPLAFTFFTVFPRTLFRSRWAWALVWLLVPVGLPMLVLFVYMVYRPQDAAGLMPVWYWQWMGAVAVLYTLTALGFLVVNYRRLEDLNERRRVRVLVAGTVVGFLGCVPVFIAVLWGGSILARLLPSPIPLLGLLLFLLFPASFAYAILRHRVFDVGVMLRQGLQYGLARGVLVSALPALGLFLVFDVIWHADQRVADVLSARGWVYAVLAGLAVVAYKQQQKWLEALDRRFFRERYDAQRLLREVVEEIRRARGFDVVAPRVAAQIEAALHPEFAALLVREPGQPSFRVLAAVPAGQVPPPLPAESKLVALLRLLNKPVEVPQTESGWLQQQLPHEETDFLRRARIDLLVPIAVAPDRTEALLAVGPKRSEEPYTRDDQDLLAAVATSLALLLEKPAAVPARVSDVFEECPRCGTCYDTGTGNCGQEGVALTVVPLPRLLAERYRLQRRLGRGGMGTVYAATDTALERPVAVKVIRDELVGNADAAERFRREARAAAGFTHPNVVTVHDFGVAARTRAFLVMELLRGAALREELQAQKRLAPARTLEILRGVCAAVEAAHRRQLIHRDLKPENIFLARDETGEVPKILDFGIAKFLPAATASTVDTGGGLLVGTLHYMAPEQLRGESVSPAWDLWALAVVAYEMLTGARPFPDASAAEWQSAVLLGRFAPVADRLPEAPARWQEFFAQTFAPQPDRRPSSAADFFSRLERALA